MFTWYQQEILEADRRVERVSLCDLGKEERISHTTIRRPVLLFGPSFQKA
jgi:hypothetical protein